MSAYTNKVVLVTGAGEGIGKGICKAFAEHGAIVGLNDVDAALAHAAAAEINDQLDRPLVHALPADVGEPDQIRSMVEAFKEKVGVPDVVIANAGITRYIGFLETTPDLFDQVVAVNQRGTYFLAQVTAKEMIAAKKQGRILLMSSVVGTQAHPNFSVYGMTKAAIQMLAKSLALELGPYQITVNAISPGATLTPRVLKEDPGYAENWATVNLTERVGSCDDVAAAALYLASDAAGQVTGHNLVVDGGWSVRSPMPN